MNPPPSTPTSVPWYRELDKRHLWLLLVATLGWLFDSMDQRLFVLARTPALRELLVGASDAEVARHAAWATSIFILGWATGGLVFGLFGDRWGRARTMKLTIVIYSLFTGLSALSIGWYDFAAYRFCCGLGIGGEYAAGVALVAEAMPARARPYCLGLLQGLSALGHVTGSLVSLVIGPQAEFNGIAGWRLLFLVGVLPALLALVIRRRLQEPAAWVEAHEQMRRAASLPKAAPDSSASDDEFHKQMGDVREIFRSRQLLYHVLIGMALGVCGQIGLWSVGYWTPELIRGSQLERRQAESPIQASTGPLLSNLDDLARRETADEDEAKSLASKWRREDDRVVAVGTVLQDAAGMFGIYAFTLLTVRVGRRAAFAVAFFLAYGATVFTFLSLKTTTDAYWMAPLLGFSISSVYGGYAIYFPELFPTRLRSTGTGLCYNAARYVTAFGPILLGQLIASFAASGVALPLRSAAVAIATIYLAGAVAAFFAPETHGRPLPT